MFPATRAIQKELLPLVDTDGLVKPTLQVIVEECVASGIEAICVVVEKGGGGAFREHFRAFHADDERVFAGKPVLRDAGRSVAALAERITYAEQPSPEGFGHAVYQAKDFVGDEPFVLLLGDHVYETPVGVPRCVAQMLDAGAATGGSVTSVRLEPESGVGVTGIVQGRPLDPTRAAEAPGQIYEIVALREKPTVAEAQALATPGLPEGFYLGHFGIHLFTPEIFDCLGTLIAEDRRVKNEIQLTSGQELLLARAQDGSAPAYRALRLDGTRLDIGLPDEYLKTLIALGRRGPYASDLP
jgi:UTP--glucose-1-phosphate uridylyltransferase